MSDMVDLVRGAAMLGVSTHWLRILVHRVGGPPHTRVGRRRCIMFDRSALEAWGRENGFLVRGDDDSRITHE